MRTTQILLATLKQTAESCETIGHQLMLRAGLIRQVAAGIYAWLPHGKRILKKVEAIIRSELDAIGGIEIALPALQPLELWERTGRAESYGSELITLHDRHKRPFVLGPTHEELITSLLKNEVHSYKQLPLLLYQIQTKFRDERRPKAGVLRAREFLMKDAYSFHSSKASLQEMYRQLYRAYINIFDRVGLKVRVVEADTGAIGGHLSHEFQALSPAGEDVLLCSEDGQYCANLEVAHHASPDQIQKDAHAHPPLACEDLRIQLVRKSTGSAKHTDGWLGLVYLSKHSLHPLKLLRSELPLAAPLQFANEATVKQLCGTEPDHLTPQQFTGELVADNSLSHLAIDWGSRLPPSLFLELRTTQAGDLAPDGKSILSIARGIEVGHMFQLGTHYSQVLGATVQHPTGRIHLEMGCYGLGVSRMLTALIEQHHDHSGILWPRSVAPYQAIILPVQFAKDANVKLAAESLYKTLKDASIEVLLDDRGERLGVMFADALLLGCPDLLILSPQLVAQSVVEYQTRLQPSQTYHLPHEQVVPYLKALQDLPTPDKKKLESLFRQVQAAERV